MIKTEPDCIILAISDLGIGIKQSLNKYLKINEIKNDQYFIKEALRPGVSGTGLTGRGLGLTNVINSIEEVQITSGLGQVITKNGRISKEKTINTKLFGTSIYLKINI